MTKSCSVVSYCQLAIIFKSYILYQVLQLRRHLWNHLLLSVLFKMRIPHPERPLPRVRRQKIVMMMTLKKNKPVKWKSYFTASCRQSPGRIQICPSLAINECFWTIIITTDLLFVTHQKTMQCQSSLLDGNNLTNLSNYCFMENSKSACQNSEYILCYFSCST